MPIPVLKNDQFSAPERNDAPVGWDSSARGLLEMVRFQAMSCRASARTDLFEACAVLAMSTIQAQATHAETLVSCLGPTVGRRSVFFRPGTDELSFDEAWLARAFEALLRNDEQSFEFLIRSRIPFEARRSIAFLIRQIVEQRNLF